MWTENTHMQRGGHVEVKAELKVICLPAKKLQAFQTSGLQDGDTARNSVSAAPWVPKALICNVAPISVNGWDAEEMSLL